MAFDQSTQPVLSDPRRESARRYVWPSVFERAWFKVRVADKTPIGRFYCERRRGQCADWTPFRWPSVFFQSPKSLKTIAWFPYLPRRATLRHVLRHERAFFVHPSGHLMGPGGTGGGASQLILIKRTRDAVRKRRRQSRTTTFFGSFSPKLGDKTAPPDER